MASVWSIGLALATSKHIEYSIQIEDNILDQSTTSAAKKTFQLHKSPIVYSRFSVSGRVVLALPNGRAFLPVRVSSYPSLPLRAAASQPTPKMSKSSDLTF